MRVEGYCLQGVAGIPLEGQAPPYAAVLQQLQQQALQRTRRSAGPAGILQAFQQLQQGGGAPQVPGIGGAVQLGALPPGLPPGLVQQVMGQQALNPMLYQLQQLASGQQQATLTMPGGQQVTATDGTPKGAMNGALDLARKAMANPQIAAQVGPYGPLAVEGLSLIANQPWGKWGRQIAKSKEMKQLRRVTARTGRKIKRFFRKLKI